MSASYEKSPTEENKNSAPNQQQSFSDLWLGCQHLYAGRQQPSPIQGTTKLRPSCLKVAPRVILSASSHSFSLRSWLFTPRIDIHVLGLGYPQLVGDPLFAQVEPSTIAEAVTRVLLGWAHLTPHAWQLWKNWQARTYFKPEPPTVAQPVLTPASRSQRN